MNKVVTSAGLLALGAAAVYGYDPEMTRAQSGRWWTVSATVRGFYDDNPTLTPEKSVVSPVGPKDSFGFEVSPSAHINLPLEQTFIRAGYVYSLRYFERRDPHNVDQSHEFDALLRHAFSPRSDISVTEGLYYSDEPTVVDKVGGIFTTTTRTDVTALHNHGAIDYNVALTQVLSLGLGYANEWYDYDDDGPGSRSAVLDRLEHFLHADLRYQVDPALVALIGYQLGIKNYTADQFLFQSAVPPLQSDDRDSISHYIYAGLDHDFSTKLRGSVRLGAQITDYMHEDETDISPYADASLNYTYMPGSAVRVGIKHQRVSTDVVTPDLKGQPTLDQEATSGYVELTHQITRSLTANLLGQIQYATFNGGGANDENETLYLLGLNLAYRINEHFTVEGGYNYDMLDSDLKTLPVFGKRYEVRSYDRNRVYIGLRATY